MKCLAKQIRKILQEFEPDAPITYAQIALRLDFVTNREKRRLYGAIREFINRGECAHIGQGVVRYVPGKTPGPAKKMTCMHRLIRANRSSTIAPGDLMSICGVTKQFAHRYLNELIRCGFARRIALPGNRGFKYQLVKDPGPELIRNEETNAIKRARQRAVRAAKKRGQAGH